MLKIFLLILFINIISCTQEIELKDSKVNTVNNKELQQMYLEDQNDRESDDIDWNIVSINDSIREKRAYALLDSGKVQTSLDYYNIAMIFQHGSDTIASGMAVKMMKKSIEFDSTANKWLLAAAIDRDLMRKQQPQIYGTQYIILGDDKIWELYKIDTTKITDAQRIEYGVETLSEQREKVIMMNKKKSK